MPFENPLAAEGNPDALRHVESFHAPPDKIAANVHAQLTNPQDIASANQFFKPTGANQFLPTVGHVGPQGIELGAITPVGKVAMPPMTGLETQALHFPPGGEMAALSGAHGAVMPGAEQISPLINMIMKMPGHIGLANAFFEALGAFFAPAQEMLGHLIEGFDPGALFEHAGSAAESMSGALESAGDHLPVDLSLLPSDAPIFEQLGHGAAAGNLTSGSLEVSGHGLGGTPHLTDSFAGANRLEVGGGPARPMFELAPEAQPLSFNAPNNNYLAMEPNHGFGATVGSLNSAPVAAPQPVPTHIATPAPAANPAAPTTTAHGSHAIDFGRDVPSSSRDHLLGDTTSSATHGMDSKGPSAQHQEIHQGNDHKLDQGNAPGDKQTPGGDRIGETHGQAKVESTNYKVHHGDNLWNIARNHLGDGTRWQEIYDLNKSVLGDNARMIMPGTELQLPGGDVVANGSLGNADYTVQPGDNLWTISQEHLGGGQNWHELYQSNEAVVGSDPAMLHPGQHLQIDASAHGQSFTASGDTGAGGHADAGSHADADQTKASGSGHNLTSGSSHSHHLASHPHGPVHNHNVANASPTHPAKVANIAGTAGSAPRAASVELKAEAQPLSNNQS